jgi:hypothetical protein
VMAQYQRRVATNSLRQDPQGVWTDPLALNRESEMKWRVMVELIGGKGTAQLHEVSAGGCATMEYSPETVGLTIAEGKEVLAGLQRHLVKARTAEHCQPTRLRALWRATPAQGYPSPAVDVLVRRRGGSCSPFRPLPMRRRVATDDHPGRGDHARPLHAGI